MLKIRNYVVKLINGTSFNVTSEEADAIERAWGLGGIINIAGERFAAHQITGIALDYELGEDDAKKNYGVSLKEALRTPELAQKYQNLLNNKSMS